MDLTTNYLGLRLPHPLVAGASPLVDDLELVQRVADAGASAIVMHSLFEEQILEQIRRIRRRVPIPVIASLNGTTEGSWLAYARSMQEAGASAIELNLYELVTSIDVSAEDVERRSLAVVRAVRKNVTIPVAVKLSPFYTSLPRFASELVAAGADGIVLFNRFYQADIDADALEVVRSLRLSDPGELLLRLRWLAILSAQVRTSYAVSGGVHSGLDAVKAVMTGADCVQVVSALLRHGPERMATLVSELSEWLEQHEYDSLEQARGSMNLKRCPDPRGFERANYVQVLQSWRFE
jgi:dihydroorotate dehydrogenase (fumarate)